MITPKHLQIITGFINDIETTISFDTLLIGRVGREYSKSREPQLKNEKQSLENKRAAAIRQYLYYQKLKRQIQHEILGVSNSEWVDCVLPKDKVLVISDMEEFRTIEYRGYKIEVSNLGNVKTMSGKKNRKLQTNSSGYSSFTTPKHILLVHRMVAIAFIPNPENKLFVNHKDGNKKNNTVENLEWVTKQENELHSTRVLGNKRNTSGLINNQLNSVNKRRIDLFKLNGEFVCRYGSLKECADALGVNITAVCNMLQGHSKTVKGYVCAYVDDKYIGKKLKQ